MEKPKKNHPFFAILLSKFRGSVFRRFGRFEVQFSGANWRFGRSEVRYFPVRPNTREQYNKIKKLKKISTSTLHTRIFHLSKNEKGRP